MVKAKGSWPSSHNSSQQLPDLICMSTLLEPRQQECLPSRTNQCTCNFSTPVALPGSADPHLQNSKTEQKDEGHGHGSRQCLPLDFPALLPTPNLCTNYGLSRMVMPNAKYSGPCQKGFLIFDQSENQTRLFYNYGCPPIHNPSLGTARLTSNYDDLDKLGHAAQMDRNDPAKNILHEASGENEESEMHEDTEEINALLYSDDYEEDESDTGECGEDDDEVTSPDHSPMQLKKDYVKRGPIEEDVASSDGSRKRQKVLDGGYNKSSPSYTASSINLDGSHGYDNDAKSSYADGQTGVEGSECTLGNMRSKKDKVREVLRVLESIIPGVKGKDPLLVIDEAIDYLRIAKLKAETLGVRF
ncbi:transcription factor bHLH143-like [Humulus lupulus]|uniref:transcription factor bHLH143-like n=1 Tax=Humulus lupulus TaxID=3486 RepID=UPI002B4132A4|nr:transcription factor bHLH143-like [Humulus lupulus]